MIDASYLDVELEGGASAPLPDIARRLLIEGVEGFAIDTLVVRSGVGILSRAAAFELIDVATHCLDQPDDVFAEQETDICLAFFLPGSDNRGALPVYRAMRVRGVPVVTFCTDAMLDLADCRYDGLHSVLARTAIYSDAVVVDTPQSAARLVAFLNEVHSERIDHLAIFDAKSLNRACGRVAALLLKDLMGLFARIRTEGFGNTTRVTRWVPNERILLRADNELLVKNAGELRGDKFHIHQKRGICIYGPYLKLHAGQYRVIVRINVDRPAESHIDVCVDSGRTVLAHSYLRNLNAREGSIALDVLLPPHAALEIRLHAAAESNIVLNSYEIVRTPPPDARVRQLH